MQGVWEFLGLLLQFFNSVGLYKGISCPPWSAANASWLQDTRTLEMQRGISLRWDYYIHCKGNREWGWGRGSQREGKRGIAERKRESDRRERVRPSSCVLQMLHIGGRSTVVHKKTQPGTRFNPIVHKSQPSNEGHFARGGFFFQPLFFCCFFFYLFLSFSFFEFFLLGQKACFIKTRHKSECEALTAAGPQFFTEEQNRMNCESSL